MACITNELVLWVRGLLYETADSCIRMMSVTAIQPLCQRQSRTDQRKIHTTHGKKRPSTHS